MDRGEGYTSHSWNLRSSVSVPESSVQEPEWECGDVGGDGRRREVEVRGVPDSEGGRNKEDYSLWTDLLEDVYR